MKYYQALKRGLTVVMMVMTAGVFNSVTAQEVRGAGDLVWSDEFDGTVIDDTKWERLEYNRRNNDAGPDGWWSNEDSYLDGEGHLVIRVRQIANVNTDDDSCDFSVGMVRSHSKFEKLYGKFEISCQLPTQQGWWVAFWMMQGNVSSTANAGVDGSEVDIMEGFGWSDKINQAIHWDGYGTAHKSRSTAKYPAGIRDGYHTYTLEWYPGIYIFYIDGSESWRSTGGGVCNQKGYIKVTGELSTESWAIADYWAKTPYGTAYPDSFMVDYVRVYDIDESLYPAVGTGGLAEVNRIRLFPNPADEQVSLTWDPAGYDGMADISLYTMDGKLVRKEGRVENGYDVDMRELPSGIYMLGMEMGGRVGYLKLIKD